MSVKMDSLSVSIVGASTAASNSNQPVLKRLSALEGMLEQLSADLIAVGKSTSSEQSSTMKKFESFALVLTDIKSQVHEESSKSVNTSAQYAALVAGLEGKLEGLQASILDVKASIPQTEDLIPTIPEIHVPDYSDRFDVLEALIAGFQDRFASITAEIKVSANASAQLGLLQ